MNVKPILKWAGGKSQLASVIHNRIPKKFHDNDFSYVEPFIGGGAMFFWMKNNFSNMKTAIINDVNSDLINCYKVVQTNVEDLIELLRNFEEQYRSTQTNPNLRSELYYNMRTDFNSKAGSNILQAAQLIFLNKTCFNGLYRVNRKGEFNVPIGSYKNPNICDIVNLRNVSKSFEDTIILNEDYAETIKYAESNVLFYLDPPYKPISATSSFNAYAKGSFNDDEQVRLSKFCRELSAKDVSWILSNSDVDTDENPNKFFDDLYDGFDIRRVSATRAINSVSAKRGKLNELLISN